MTGQSGSCRPDHPRSVSSISWGAMPPCRRAAGGAGGHLSGPAGRSTASQGPGVQGAPEGQRGHEAKRSPAATLDAGKRAVLGRRPPPAT